MANFYTEIGVVNQFALDYGQNERWDELSEQRKTYLVALATKDIEDAHGMPRTQFNIPWRFGDVNLREAANWQALHIMRTIGPREWSERAAVLGRQNVNDMVISVGMIGTVGLDSTADGLVRRVMATSRVSQQKVFGRG